MNITYPGSDSKARLGNNLLNCVTIRIYNEHTAPRHTQIYLN